MMKDKEAFLAELRKAEDPEQMDWIMANFLLGKAKEKMHHATSDGDDQRYGHTWDSRYSLSDGRDFHGARYSDNGGMGGIDSYRSSMHPFTSGRSARFSKESMEEAKEYLGKTLGRSISEDDLKCLIMKEAASVIKRLCKDEPFEAVKEFTEMCIAMKGYAETLPVELEEQAKEEAIGKYMEMFSHRERYGHSSFRARLIHDDGEYHEPVRRVRLDDMGMGRNRQFQLPTVEVDEFNFRGRSRDSMGRYK
jgi:hypothetical protein